MRAFYTTVYLISINTVLNVSKTGQFRDPPTQFFCWRNIGRDGPFCCVTDYFYELQYFILIVFVLAIKKSFGNHKKRFQTFAFEQFQEFEYFIDILDPKSRNATFHPFRIFRHRWSSMFTFLFTFLFIWKVLRDLNLD